MSFFRVPTETEWYQERRRFDPLNRNGAFNSFLKLPCAGNRWGFDNTFYQVGYTGYYWSSDVWYPSSPSFRILAVATLLSGELGSGGLVRSHGCSLRLIRDTPHIGNKNTFVSQTIVLDGLIYKTVISPFTNRVWLDRNLGATQVATSFNDPLSYGDLYQWGRLKDGHEKRNSTTTPILSTTDIPGHNKFILAPDFPHDWRSTHNDDLWKNSLTEGNLSLGFTSTNCTSLTFSVFNNIPYDTYNSLIIESYINNQWVEVGVLTKTSTSINVDYYPLLNLNQNYNFRLKVIGDQVRYSNTVQAQTIEVNYNISSISNLLPSIEEGKWMYEITSLGSNCFPITLNNFKLKFRLQGESLWNLKSVNTVDIFNDLKQSIHSLEGGSILRYNDTYEVQAVYNDTLYGDVETEIETLTTPNIIFPININYINGLYSTLIKWDLINYDYYYNCKIYIQVDGIGEFLINPDSNYLNYNQFNITNLNKNTEYTWRFKIVHSNEFHPNDKTYISNDYKFKTKLTLPKSLCNSNLNKIKPDCGNNNGGIYISIDNEYTVYDYLELFNFSLLVYDLNTNTESVRTDVTSSIDGIGFNNLESGYYHLTITTKPDAWYFYGREECVNEWIKLDNNTSTVGVNSIRAKPAICSGFDNQPGRLQVQLDGVSAYYKYWFFNSDGLLINNGTTTNPYIVLNNATECYYGVIEDSNGCRYLMDEVCIPVETSSSISGIKQLFIAPVTGDIDFDYYNTEDDDYYLDGEDNSFFMSTKISRINTNLTWYKIPIHNGQVSFNQSLNKNRQGFIFSDVMEIGIAHQTQEKLNTLLRNLLNKFIVVFQDNNGNWWISGYTSHASLDTVVLTTGRRYDSNQYTLNITSNSADNIITNIDEDWVKNNILN